MSNDQEESVFLDDAFIEEIDKALDEYEKKIGLPQSISLKAPEYLTMSLPELRKKTADQLSEAVFEINQYSLFLQRDINKNKAWLSWAKNKLNELSASYLPQVAGSFGYNEREIISKNTPPLCKKLNAFMRKLSMRLDRVSGVPEQIKSMSDSIRDLKFIALKREKNYGNNQE